MNNEQQFSIFVFPLGRKKDNISPSSPGSSALLDEIRQMLLDYQTTRTNAVNEVC